MMERPGVLDHKYFMYVRASGPSGVADGGLFPAAVGWVRGRSRVARITCILSMIVHMGV